MSSLKLPLRLLGGGFPSAARANGVLASFRGEIRLFSSRDADPVEEINKEFSSVFGDALRTGDPLVSPTSGSSTSIPEDPFSVIPTSTTAAPLSHVDAQGKVSMVDVSGKPRTARMAAASARVVLGPTTFRQVAENQMKKGDVLATARIAGISGAKATSSLIPLCHSISLSHVSVDLTLHPNSNTVHVLAQASTVAGTGVEMEALTAASVAALTVYDMCKAVDKGIVIERIQLESKSGGKSGPWER